MTSKEYAPNLARGIRVRFTLKAHPKDGQYCTFLALFQTHPGVPRISGTTFALTISR